MDQSREIRASGEGQQEPSHHERLLDDSLGSAKSTDNSGKDRVIDIAEADKIFGWWQKKQYADIGVQKIHLSPDRVGLDLKAAAEKYRTLQLDPKVAFSFETHSNGWTITDVQGLKLKGTPITKVESNASKLTFWTGNKTTDYGGAVNNYFKALFDPLMRKDLRK